MTPPPPNPSDDSLLHAGRFLHLRTRRGWEYAHRPGITGIIAVVPVTAEGRLVLVEQYRIPVERRVFELPAGLVGDDGPAGELLAEAAARELEEETGYRAGRMELLTEGPPSPGMSDEVVTFFRAHAMVRVGSGGGVAGEDIIVHEIALADVPAWLRAREAEGHLVDPKVYIGLWFVSTGASSSR